MAPKVAKTKAASSPKAGRVIRAVVDVDDEDDTEDGVEEDYDTLVARQAGPSMDELTGKSTLSRQDRDKASSYQWKKRDDDEEETAPLTPALKRITYGKALVSHRLATLDPATEAMCVSIANNGSTVAVGCRNGKLKILNSKTMELMDTHDVGGGSASTVVVDLPAAVTAAHFRPTPLGATMQNVLLLAAGARVVHLHTSTGRVLAENTEVGNSISALSLRKDGASFVSAGSDKALRLYDSVTCKLTASMAHGDDKHTAGHSSRVYGLVWACDDDNVILSGGWDRTVQVWDVRAGHSVTSLFGPYICGDALDVRGSKVLTGSWRHDNPLQLWDLRTSRLMTNLPFYQPEPDACLLYSAKFIKGAAGGGIVAGGSGKKACVKYYSATGELLGTLSSPSPVHSLACTEGPQPTIAVCSATQLSMVVLP